MLWWNPDMETNHQPKDMRIVTIRSTYSQLKQLLRAAVNEAVTSLRCALRQMGYCVRTFFWLPATVVIPFMSSAKQEPIPVLRKDPSVFDRSQDVFEALLEGQCSSIHHSLSEVLDMYKQQKLTYMDYQDLDLKASEIHQHGLQTLQVELKIVRESLLRLQAIISTKDFVDALYTVAWIGYLKDLNCPEPFSCKLKK